MAEVLAKRAEALITGTKAVLAELYKQGKGHLASSIEHQIVLVEALTLDLKKSLADTSKHPSVHHVHVIEEDLLWLENRISEELYIITHLGDGHHEEHKNGTDTMAQKLVAHANSIIHQAEEILKDGTTIRLRDARDMAHEIGEIKKLIKAIEAHPSAAELKAEATQLAKHEESLRTLIERAKHPHHGNTKMPPINSPFL